MTKAKRPKFGMPRRRSTPAVQKVTVEQALEIARSTLNEVTVFRGELRAALERKPNQGLQDLVDAVKQCAYQLKAQRAELDQLALQLEANTTVVTTLVGRAPTVPPVK